MANQTPSSKEGLKMRTDKQKIELLNKKIQELTTENQILREINVKLQIENFKLQKKLDSKQLDEELNDSNDRVDTEIEESAGNQEFYTVVYDDDAAMAQDMKEIETEYLDDESNYEVQEEEVTKDYTEINNIESIETRSVKRSYTKVFEEDDPQREQRTVKVRKEDVKYEFTVLNNDNEEMLLTDTDEALESENCQISPKEAILQIYNLAAKSATLQKIKAIEKGKQKDSAFVSKVLDLLFDKITLATSTAQGQKCQSKLHLPAKPALDQNKVDLCMKAFQYRLDQENIKEEEKQTRLKLFNKLVNDKIQNCRKCIIRTDSSKLLET